MFALINKIFNKIMGKLSSIYYRILGFRLQDVESLNDLIKRYPTAYTRYIFCYQSFFKFIPFQLRAHRRFFQKNKRGFGENAFHTMWWLLFNEFKPKKILEIGVYRGQTITLFSLLGRTLGYTPEIHGISPFSSDGDSVSNYVKIDYYADVQENISAFNLNNIKLHKCYSNEQAGLRVISSDAWDMVYIDGSHDYDVVLSDFENAFASLKPGGILVMDDSSLLYEERLPSFAFPGHPGPSTVAKEIAMRKMKFVVSIGHNSVFLKTA